MSRFRSLLSLEGKSVAVTGAASGLGREIALALADFGVTLALADRDCEPLEAFAASLRADGAVVTAVTLDVTDPDGVVRFFAPWTRDGVRLDALIHCAGVGGRAPAEGYPMELWDTVIGINAGGTFLCAQAAGRIMLRQQNGGSIVLMASNVGIMGVAGSVGYQVSKAMVVQMARSLGVEWAARGVRVNAIAPGLFSTPATAVEIEREPEHYQRFVRLIPQGRPGAPHELIGAAVFLASDASTHVTGHTLVVDGGTLAQ